MQPRGIVIIGIAVALLGMRWSRSDPGKSAPVIIVGAAYAVDVSHGQATIDLKFAANQRYLLVLGSLGAAEQDYTVKVAAEPTDEVKRQNISRVEPLRLRRLTSRVPGRSTQNETNESTRSAEAVRDFHLHVTEHALENARGYHRIHARLLAEGLHVRVYLDGDQRASEIHPGIADELVRVFDEEVLPVSRRHLGTHRDVDGDGKFAILLTHWLGKLQGGRTSVGGFVRNSDFHSAVGPPFGNRADVMYLNSNITPGPPLRTLLAHEYAHAVLFSARTAKGIGPAAHEEDWLNEAIAHQAENLQGRDWSNLDYRISTFLNDPAQYPLVVPDYYRTGRWRDHGCRGATYLFLRWCLDEFEPGLLGRLIQGPESGLRNLTRATGVSFTDLFRHWSVALALPPESPGGDEQERLRFLSLHGPIGRYGLVGARRDRWDVAGSSQLFSLHGTAVRVIEVAAGQSPGVYRISLTASQAAKMQVTVIKLPAEQQSLDFQAYWETFSDSGTDMGDVLVVETAADSSADLQLEMVSCEQKGAEPGCSVCFGPQDLEAATARIGRLLKLPIPRRVRKQQAGEWIVKVLARDSHGQHTIARCRVRDEALLARQE